MRSANSYNRIVIKIGSAVLANTNGIVRHNILSSISEDIAWLLKNDKEVLIVSSGAIALGRKKITLSENLTLAESQAMAAHGQIELMSAWKKHFNKFSMPLNTVFGFFKCAITFLAKIKSNFLYFFLILDERLKSK